MIRTLQTAWLIIKVIGLVAIAALALLGFGLLVLWPMVVLVLVVFVGLWPVAVFYMVYALVRELIRNL